MSAEHKAKIAAALRKSWEARTPEHKAMHAAKIKAGRAHRSSPIN